MFVVQSETGSIVPGGSFSTVVDAIDELAVRSVILLGIAFGVDPKKQSLGDVLVSRQLQCYEIQRVGTGENGQTSIIPRGDKVSASTRLIDRLRTTTVGRKETRVSFGLVLSGEKLVDNVDFRDQIVDMCPEAIGGELEGAGTYAAAVARNKEWVIAKAICDWADGKKRHRKEERQQKAAAIVAEFVIDGIKLGGFGP